MMKELSFKCWYEISQIEQDFGQAQQTYAHLLLTGHQE